MIEPALQLPAQLQVAEGAEARRVDTATAESPLRSRFIQPIVFVGGLTSIGIELSASRLLAPYFGSSTFIWANLIGLTLTYLAIGYYAGGRLVDRFPDPRLLYGITATAALFSGLIPLFSRPILDRSLTAFDRVEVGAFYGSLVGTIFLFAIPVTLLGFVTPFAIRLQIGEVRAAGATAGRIYALSTVGSILGSFLPVLVIIPLFGTRASFYSLSGALLLLSFAGLVECRASLLSLFAVVMSLVITGGALQARGEIKPPYLGTLVHEGESEYNYIQVLKLGDTYLLALDEGHAIHSEYNPNRLLTGGPWDYFTVAPLFGAKESVSRPSSALMIGLAGGTAARELLAAYPGMQVDGVEIDQAVVDAGRAYFDMNDSRLNVIVQDGRYFLRTTDRRYDVIGVDAYRQPYIPFQLTTKEFFSEASEHLNPCGSVVVNVGRTETDYRLVDVIGSTMRAVFPHVYEIDVPEYDNTMVVGVSCDSSIATFGANSAALADGSLVKTVAETALSSGNIREVAPGGRIFTDDKAPVELVTDEIIVGEARKEEHQP
jgi:spermidine synthase